MSSPSQVVRVALPRTAGRSYTVRIQPGLLGRLPAFLRGETEKIFLITDSHVRRLYGRTLLRAILEEGRAALLIEFPSGESSKNSAVAELLYTALLEGGVRRESTILALGGGVVGDLAGYVAATILRGVRFLQIPTTLLAQVDSSVGGKVGIDHPRGKNLIGAFYQPAGVYVDPEVLRTLSERQFRNGLAEIAKIAFALDSSFVRLLERVGPRIDRTDAQGLVPLLERAIGLKAAVVARDERESSLRKVLNLGHTIGHALEAASGYRIPHGFAVSIGMATEAKIAQRLGLLHPDDAARMVSLLETLRLPVRFPKLTASPGQFFAFLAADKKSGARGARFVLPIGTGRCAVGVEVPSSLIAEVTRIPQ